MKILLCHERFLFRYGVDRVLLLLAEQFRQRGHHVTLLGMRFDESADQAAGRLIEVPGFEPYIESDLRTHRWLEDNGDALFADDSAPDIVLAAGWPFFAAMRYFRARGWPVFFSDHGITPSDGLDDGTRRTLALLWELKRAFVPFANGVIPVSRFIRETQSLVCADADQPVRTILNGVDHAGRLMWGEAPEEEGEADLLPGDAPRIVFLGRFEPGTYKRSELVFEIEKQVAVWAPSARLAVLAPQSEVDAAAPPRSKVVGIGHPSDAQMYHLIASCDVACCLSLWEGFNLPLAEAQALGCPCLVFEAGAHAEVVASDWLLCRDVDEMAGKIRLIVQEEAPHEVRDKSVFSSYAQERNWEGVAAKYLAVFEEHADPMPRRDCWIVRRNDLLLIDVTNSVRDPANSGVVRVTRRLSAQLQQFKATVFVVWDRSLGCFRFPDVNEWRQLSTFGGPSRPEGHPESREERKYLLSDWLGTAKAGGWLILPEIRHREDLLPILRQSWALGLKTASVFYDAIPLLRPDFVVDPIYRDGHADYMRGLAGCSVNIAISDFSAACLRDFWNEAGLTGRVVSCLLPGGFPGERPESVALDLARQGENPFMLCVSTIEPRKNHRRLIEAFLRLRETMPDPAWDLVLVGNSYAGAEELVSWVREVCDRGCGVRWLGIVSDEELADLYARCEFTVYPSEIEGFGLPVLESIWHGRPCLCNRSGVMAELAQPGGCLTTDVTNIEAFADAMGKLVYDTDLRQELAEACRRRSIRNWPGYADDFIGILALSASESFGQQEAVNQLGDMAPMHAVRHDPALTPARDSALVSGVFSVESSRTAVLFTRSTALAEWVSSHVVSCEVFDDMPMADGGGKRTQDVTDYIARILAEFDVGGDFPEVICMDGDAFSSLSEAVRGLRPPVPCRLVVVGDVARDDVDAALAENPYIHDAERVRVEKGRNGELPVINLVVAEMRSEPRALSW